MAPGCSAAVRRERRRRQRWRGVWGGLTSGALGFLGKVTGNSSGGELMGGGRCHRCRKRKAEGQLEVDRGGRQRGLTYGGSWDPCGVFQWGGTEVERGEGRKASRRGL
eukprot:7901739-Pyramimonas_sp.AAC.2